MCIIIVAEVKLQLGLVGVRVRRIFEWSDLGIELGDHEGYL